MSSRIYRYHAAARVFMARLTRTARISSEVSACTIIRTFARRLRTAVSVGLKAVLVLKARRHLGMACASCSA